MKEQKYVDRSRQKRKRSCIWKKKEGKSYKKENKKNIKIQTDL